MSMEKRAIRALAEEERATIAWISDDEAELYDAQTDEITRIQAESDDEIRFVSLKACRNGRKWGIGGAHYEDL